MRISTLLPLLAFASVVPGSARSGPHEGGVMIVHAPEELGYTAGADYCGQSGLEQCTEADAVVEGDEITVAFLLAAFPQESSPRLAATFFGIHYDANEIEILDWNHCGDYHNTSNDWPDPASGIAIAWDEPQTDHVIEVLWVAARSISGNPATLAPGDNPTRGGGVYFLDDAVPANIDIAVDLGRLGFGGDPGYLPCPDAVPTVETSWGRVKGTYR
jgi:hypothetical protein